MSFDSMVSGPGRLLIRQAKEWAEILVGFETRNRYEICDERGRVLGYAAEESKGLGGILARNFLGRMRACTIHIYDRDRNEIARGVKPFRFYFHRMELFQGDRAIGAVERKFAILHREFVISNASGGFAAKIQSWFFKIWTFKIFSGGGQEIGKISKRWGGLLREAFSDADTFGVEFDEGEVPSDLRKLLLLATFLIDFTAFEQNANQGGLLDKLSD